MSGRNVLRLWTFAVFAVSTLCLAFMLYLIPLPPLVPQDYGDRLTISGIAAATLLLGLAGFIVIAVTARPGRKDLIPLAGLEVVGAAIAFLAFRLVELGR